MDKHDPHLTRRLERAVIRRQSDLPPFGERQDEGSDCTDCSHFQPTPFPGVAETYGVCLNMRSSRIGLLTDQRQGCSNHEPHRIPDAAERSATPPRTEVGNLTQLAADLDAGPENNVAPDGAVLCGPQPAAPVDVHQMQFQPIYAKGLRGFRITPTLPTVIPMNTSGINQPGDCYQVWVEVTAEQLAKHGGWLRRWRLRIAFQGAGDATHRTLDNMKRLLLAADDMRRELEQALAEKDDAAFGAMPMSWYTKTAEQWAGGRLVPAREAGEIPEGVPQF